MMTQVMLMNLWKEVRPMGNKVKVKVIKIISPESRLREDINGKKRFLLGIARLRGGSTHAQIFWPSFKKCIFGP